MKVFITGGAGFIGSHAAEFYAARGDEVVICDNLSRSRLFNQDQGLNDYNWHYLAKYSNITRIQGDVQDGENLAKHLAGADLVIHAAAQTAVTLSYEKPQVDFAINAQGTLNLLEAIRQLSKLPTVIYCSTNKVYGSNVNRIPIVETGLRYQYADPKYEHGIDETFGIDHCEHSPYGCSKLAADLYLQDYAHRYGLKIGIFRMSCIYGPRQFGIEDQGWIAWFAIAHHLGAPITIYGNGKQVRDALFVSDLIKAFHLFVEKSCRHEIFNLGGGPQNSVSLLELLELLRKMSGKETLVRYREWRPSDQKIYISDIRKAQSLLDWNPKVSIEEGVSSLIKWIRENESDLSQYFNRSPRTTQMELT